MEAEGAQCRVTSASATPQKHDQATCCLKPCRCGLGKVRGNGGDELLTISTQCGVSKRYCFHTNEMSPPESEAGARVSAQAAPCGPTVSRPWPRLTSTAAGTLRPPTKNFKGSADQRPR